MVIIDNAVGDGVDVATRQVGTEFDETVAARTLPCGEIQPPPLVIDIQLPAGLMASAWKSAAAG
jgi:hypothetical protein